MVVPIVPVAVVAVVEVVVAAEAVAALLSVVVEVLVDDCKVLVVVPDSVVVDVTSEKNACKCYTITLTNDAVCR